MKHFINSFREYKQAVSDMASLDPLPRIYFCYNKTLNKFFCSVYFSKDYLNRQNSEIIYG